MDGFVAALPATTVGPRTDLPVGSFWRGRVKPLSEKYFCFTEAKITLYSLPSHTTKGRWPTSSTRGGMQWTPTARKTSAPGADGEVVWFWRLDAGVKFVEATPQATETNQPDLREEHEGNR